MRSRSSLHAIPKLILASASPRRKEILAAAGIEFSVLPTSLPEVQKKGEAARDFACRMAQEKAQFARQLAVRNWRTPILAADTVVVVGRRTLGKPESADDARRMLRLLSGKQHKVITGLCLLYPSAASQPHWQKMVRAASTTVKFSRLSAHEINDYVLSREPMDKAGAYAIQGRASRYVEWIRGCYFNVVGLPISLLYRMLKTLEPDHQPNRGSRP